MSYSTAFRCVVTALVIMSGALWPQASHAAPAYVQGTTCNIVSVAGNATCTLTGVATNHSIHVFLWSCGPNPGFSTSLGLSYTDDITQAAHQNCVSRTSNGYLYRANTGGSSGTETIAAASDHAVNLGIYMIMEEWSGETATSGSGALDGVASDQSTQNGGAISSGSLTTSGAGDLLMVGGLCQEGSCTMAAGSGFAVHNSQSLADFTGFGTGFMYMESNNTGAAGSYSGDFTLTGNADWLVAAAAYLPATSGSPTQPWIINMSGKKRNWKPSAPQKDPLLFARAAWRKEREL